MGKLLFMESLVTGWGMCGKIVGKTVFLFHDFSMHYPRGYQRWNSSLSIKSTLFPTVLQDGENGRCPVGLSAVPEGCPAARGRSVSSEAGRPTGAALSPTGLLPGASAPGLTPGL